MKAILFSVIATLSLLPVAQAAHHESGDQKAVLVTGASTGIGRAIAERLAAEGHFVYAGARKQQDMDELNAIDNMMAVRLDVTAPEEIDAAVQLIEAEGRGLWGLVNNAGVFIGGPLVEVPIDELHWMMDVNVYGVVRVTSAFAPLIMESKGRITTIGSISGILSGTLYGQYSMTKHAIEAYTDSLAREMRDFDVEVSVIEPGNYASQIGVTAQDRMREKGYIKEGSPYESQMQRMLSMDWTGADDKDPAEVAEAAVHALFADDPYRRYMIVPNERQAQITIGKALEEVVQLNQAHAYKYSRDELVEMLDNALEATD